MSINISEKLCVELLNELRNSGLVDAIIHQVNLHSNNDSCICNNAYY